MADRARPAARSAPAPPGAPAAPDLPAGLSAAQHTRLVAAVRAHAGVIYLVTWEDDRTRRLVESLARTALGDPVPCYLWSVTEGLTLAGQPVTGGQEMGAALRHAVVNPEPAVYLFRDAYPFLDQPAARRAIRDCFRESRRRSLTVFLTGPTLVLPPDLLKEVLVFELGLPSAEDLGALVDQLVARDSPGAALPAARRDALVTAVLGLTLDEAQIALESALLAHPAASEAAADAAIAFKRQVTTKLGILSFIDSRVREGSVGGLENLKAWLEVRKGAFGPQARAHAVRVPKGLLVMGVPGCGKSLSVQLVAGMWNLPLLRLDLATVYSGRYGNPEESLQRALAVAEAVAPCVLWIDEIEKGIAGLKAGETGVATRVFGTFLTWMQEKSSPVFVAATANMIDLLPPEVLRKGRFDEVFFVDLPSSRERETIWQIHLKAHHIETQKFSLPELAQMTDHYTASEIEQVVVNTLLWASSEAREPTDHDILRALGALVPLAKTMSERIREIRRWASDRAVPASARVEGPAGGPVGRGEPGAAGPGRATGTRGDAAR